MYTVYIYVISPGISSVTMQVIRAFLLCRTIHFSSLFKAIHKRYMWFGAARRLYYIGNVFFSVFHSQPLIRIVKWLCRTGLSNCRVNIQPLLLFPKNPMFNGSSHADIGHIISYITCLCTYLVFFFFFIIILRLYKKAREFCIKTISLIV